MIAFVCEGDSLVGTVDDAVGQTGVAIVSGGNEIRCGAHRGMALLAQRLAAAGVPAFRFDRRGIGDSEGVNRSYATSAPDIAAALNAFRREQPQLTRVIAFGNCDAATALLLLADGLDALVLANPWLGDEYAPPPPASLRAHYARRLRDPATWKALLKQGLVGKIKGLARAFVQPREEPLARQVGHALAERPTTVVLASGDRTAQVFEASVQLPARARTIRIDTSSHSFAGHIDDLERILLDAVR